jgi:hypothetical protein
MRDPRGIETMLAGAAGMTPCIIRGVAIRKPIRHHEIKRLPRAGVGESWHSRWIRDRRRSAKHFGKE